MAKPEVEAAEIVNGKAAPAAYLPFKTFLSAIEALEHGIPKRIDRTVWRSQSGVVQSQIMMAFRFFNLVDTEDRPTPILHRLVEEKDKRQTWIRQLVNVSYGNLIGHDITRMTPKMLEDEMDSYNVSGETKRKAVTFFLQAAKYAEIPMHPLLLSQIRNTSGTRKRRGGRGKSQEVENFTIGGGAESGVLAGSSKTVRLRNGGSVTLTVKYDPFALSSEERNFVFALVDKLQAYADANPDGESAEGDQEE